jgi:hypothetical protein
MRGIPTPPEWAALTDSALRDVRDEYEMQSMRTAPGRLRLHLTRVARAATLELDRRLLAASEPWEVFAYDVCGPHGLATVSRRADGWALTWRERVESYEDQHAADFAADEFVNKGREPSRAPTLRGLPAVGLQ